jgi:hypothetical protein
MHSRYVLYWVIHKTVHSYKPCSLFAIPLNIKHKLYLKTLIRLNPCVSPALKCRGGILDKYRTLCLATVLSTFVAVCKSCH